jgi:hypothetical protein
VPFKQRQRHADVHICKDIFDFVNREDIPRRCETVAAGVALALRLGRGWPGRLARLGGGWERLGEAGSRWGWCLGGVAALGDVAAWEAAGRTAEAGVGVRAGRALAVVG